MASLALGLAGAVVGNMLLPGIGGSIGFAVGSTLGTVLDPQKIKGPKLSDLKVQGTEYGTPISILYGAMRIAGCCVLWKSDLIPHEHTSGGKGGPQTTTTSYTCSFAIQLCEGPIDSVLRVWADSRLVYENGAGSIDFVTYLGTEEQLPDPTGEALLGVGNVPAHRGYAYVSFTDLDLTDYGNRIPNFTFEVVTQGAATGGIRRIEEQYASGTTFSQGFSPSRHYPAITYWPFSGGTIRVKRVPNMLNSVAGELHEFDRATLSTAAVTHVGDAFPDNFYILTPGHCSPGNRWDFIPVGMYVYADDTPVPIWVCMELPIGTTIVGPALFNVSVTANDCSTPISAGNILHDAGLPSSEYIGGAVLSANGRRLFVFTAPSDASVGGVVIDKWYEIIDDELTRSGTVSPALSVYQIGFGVTPAGYGIDFVSSSFEDNGRYCWTYFGAEGASLTSQYSLGAVRLYEIDPATNNFALIPFPATDGHFNDLVGGTCAVSDDNANGTSQFLSGSIRVIRTGYAGVVTGDNLAVFTRFVAGETGTVLLSDIVADLSQRAGLADEQIDVSELTNEVHGYVIANQSDVRAAIAPLQTAYFFDAVESGALIKFPKRGQEPALTIPDEELAAHEDRAEAPPLLTFARAQEVDLPRRITTTYLDLNAAYQSGTQIAQRMVTLSRAEMAVPLPIALDSSAAKNIADRLLWTAWYERDTFTFTTPRKYGYLEPTDSIIAHGRSLRISTREEQPGGVIKWTGVQTIGAAFIPGGGALGGGTGDGIVPPAGAGGGVDGGGNLPKPIVLPQLTDLVLLDIPYIADPARQAVYWAAMAGHDRPEWKGASLQKSIDGGTNYAEIASSTRRSAIGSASTTLGDFDGGNVFDNVNRVTVVMTAGAADLASTTRTGVLNGANRAMIGDEMIQYLDAELTGPATYVLGRLLRGRNGTEWAMGAHGADETFVALPVATELASIYAEYNTVRQYKAVTFGNTLASATAQDFTNTGRSLKCFAPVLLGGGRNTAGDILLHWTRRARVNNTWIDGIDVPLGETTEVYQVTVYTDGTYATIKRTGAVTTPTLTYTAALQTTDFGSPQAVLYWGVQQLGSLGYGYQARAIT